MGCYQEGNPKKKNSIEIKANQKLDEQTSNKKEEIANETEKKEENERENEGKDKEIELPKEPNEPLYKEEIEINQQEEKINNEPIQTNLKNPKLYPEEERKDNDNNNENREKEEKEEIKDDTNDKPEEQEKKEEKLREQIEEKKPKITNFIESKTYYGHNEKVIAIIQLNSGKIATGSYDKTIRIWDIYDIARNDEDKIIKESGKIFVLLEFEDDKILAGTEENKIIEEYKLKEIAENKRIKAEKQEIEIIKKLQNTTKLQQNITDEFEKMNIDSVMRGDYENFNNKYNSNDKRKNKRK